MNERITKLAEQANAGFPIGYPSGGGGDEEWQNLVVFKQKDLKKFVELIVRECLSKIELEAEQYHEPAWAVELVNDIKEHFGVGE